MSQEPAQRPWYILPLIVFSQLAGTSLWFAGNAILPDILELMHLGDHALANITSVVQFGFISGTLTFALLSVADRFSASRVFFVSSLIAALANLAVAKIATGFYSLMALRFITGFFLAGIYPVGMKIAADWYEKGLGKALGLLVGALVLGKSFPYLIKSAGFAVSWQFVMEFTSAFAVTGGLLVLLLVHDGPYRKVAQRFRPGNIGIIFRSRDFRAAAFGYFGHMWELYTFWAYIPVMIGLNAALHQDAGYNTARWSFVLIAVGSLSCMLGGYLSEKIGSARVAFTALLVSCCCCFLSFTFLQAPATLFFVMMVLWSIAVIPDSPQFSTLVAQTAPPDLRGTALTIVNCIGFSITIVSIQLFDYILGLFSAKTHAFWIIGLGPIVGLLYIRRLLRRANTL